MAKFDSISPNSSLFASTVVVERSIRVDGLAHDARVHAEYFDPKKCEPEDIAESCVRLGEIAAAAKARHLCSPPAPEITIYLAGPKAGGPTKIGVAQNPIRRLEMLQVGCWTELMFYGLFWFIEGSAFGVEALAHRIASKMGKRMYGEWVDMDPGGAAYVVASVIHSMQQVKVADSSMWLRQRQELMRLRGRMAEPIEDGGPSNGLRTSNMDMAEHLNILKR
jgi:hypothetical protein